MRRLSRSIVVLLAILALLSVPRRASAYSVLSHQANVDAMWHPVIKPLLQERFPNATPEQLVHARAYAYGGCIIQDLGYYPFGSRFFSNLLHYVRTGDFVEALIRDARDIDEYAFALGALGHYAADDIGHPVGVNRAVPLMYPKLRAKYGDEITYAQSPKTHILVEFSFDVAQAASGVYASETYHHFVGFQVSKALLQRAFNDIYGIEMKHLFFSEDLAIATYRHAVSKTIPEMTRVAWRKKRAQIQALIPEIQREQFVFRLSPRQFKRRFGNDYQKPNALARFLAFIYDVLPKIGPLGALTFKVPTPQAEELFLESFKSTRDRYLESLEAVRAGRLDLPNKDFDTGKPTQLGEYSLADETYAELLNKLADRKFADVPEELRKNILAFYGPAEAPTGSHKEGQISERIRKQLEWLQATCTANCEP